MDHSFPNSRRHWRTTMCHSRCFYSAFLIHCPHFHQIFLTKVNHPSFAGLHPRPMHNLGWGSTAWIFLTLHLLTVAERPRTFWRRPSSAVHEVGQSLQRGQIHPPSSTAPVRSQKMLRHFHCEILPPVLHPQYALPLNTNAQSPLLHSDCNPAPPPRVKVRHQGMDQGEVNQVHRNRVPGLAVAASPRVGPQLGVKPVQVRDQFTRFQRQPEVLRSCLGMKPVGGEHDVSYSTDEADVSQGSIPLLDISAADDEGTRKRKAWDLACRSDTDFAAWKEKQISEGVKGIEERDNMVNDYMNGKRKPKNPDPLGPPVSYMEEHGVFQPLASMTNPLGLCHFYCVDHNVSMPKTPKPPATVEHVKKLLLLASTQRWPYIIVVFQGGTVTPLGLLQELHTWSALVRIPIYLPGETKDGHRPHVSCCPFCIYIIQNDLAYLNHIICVHYDANFTCRTCLSAVTSSGQQMNHIKECSGLDPPPTALQESVPGGHLPKKSAPGSKHMQGKKKGHRSEKSQPAGQAS